MENLLASKKRITKSSARTFFLPDENGVVTHFGIGEEGLVQLSPGQSVNRTQNFEWPPAPPQDILRIPPDDFAHDSFPNKNGGA